MYRNKAFTETTLTDAGVVTLDPVHFIQDEFEGVVGFDVLADTVSGVLDGDCQLQGSIDGTNYVNIGSTVAIADGVSVHIPLGGTILYFAFYKVIITGVGTQSTTINGNYLAKGRK